MNESHYCSQFNPAEPMAGTADQVDIWLLLEYRPSWKAKVLEDNELAASSREWLQQTLARLRALGCRVRPQFIRQPEYDRSGVTVMLATAEDTWKWELSDYSELATLDMAAQFASARWEGQRLVKPEYFVCMNGQRDRCCARYGRPVYAALRERVAERAWQISHLGGHRFAPNVLCLPQGALYGRLAEQEVALFTEKVEGGELDFSCLRGRSWFAPAVQAAEGFQAEQGLILKSSREDGERTTVTFARTRSDSMVEEPLAAVTVQRSKQPLQALASCGDQERKPVRPFEKVKTAL